MFSQLDFWMAFNKSDPKALPEELDLLDEFSVDELGKLLCHYGDDKFDIYSADESHQRVDLDPVVAQAEWNSYIRMMFQHRKLYEHSIGLRLTKENDKEKVEKFMKDRKIKHHLNFMKTVMAKLAAISTLTVHIC